MGTNLRDIIIKKDLSFEELRGKVLVVDSYNILYQFLSSIRQRDGSLLTDANGAVTSHLTGLFTRTSKLMEYGMQLAFVFDGTAPQLKRAEISRRHEIKKEAVARYEQAVAAEDVDGMRKYAARTSRLSSEMVAEAKALIDAMGCPIIQAVSEGEAQAAHMVAQGDAYAVVSEDYDSLLYGAPRLVKNLSITGRKKQKDRLSYETISPSLIVLEENLRALAITREQLIALAMLVGTDFNYGGVKGIGQKKALALVLKHRDDLGALFSEVKWGEYSEHSWEEVFSQIRDMPVSDDYSLSWRGCDEAKIIELLVTRHNFSEPRVRATVERLSVQKKMHAQRGLTDFFG